VRGGAASSIRPGFQKIAIYEAFRDFQRRQGQLGLIGDVEVRQPANVELVGRRFSVAGLGAGLEGTIRMRLLNPRRRGRCQ
jgi:hypothetical protein